ncbi:MAG: pantoate--beta-alanine ligase [Proteobacteria bacterium]|nr:MAG: pantoate--beta-alanine ligase [Pseudomonadota bacterium]QKK11814.1 MAG: pantoate--beta-alanine ligase [Pseudomonadota bacterium]
MQTVTTVADLRAAVAGWRTAGQRVALVPTMGNLHEGHLQLVDRARALADRVVVSIFVNPTQFSPNEDFARYPRTLESDSAKLEPRGTDLIFAPSVEEVYPEGTAMRTRVEVPGLSDELCGSFRPHHFAGVATVVTKLFGMVQPDVAVFGTKDFQQLLVIRHLVVDLHLPVAIEGVTTVREPDGLAMSSRNAYLSAEDRQTATAINRCLRHTAQRLLAGERDFAALEAEGAAALQSVGFRPDYYAVRRSVDLDLPAPEDKDLVVLTAAHIGGARLIDNLPVQIP